MAICFITAIIIAVLAAGAFSLYIYYKKKKKGTGATIFVVAGAIFSVVFLLVPFSFHTVDTGEIAVVKEMGKIVDTRDAGTHFDFWLTRTYTKYDTKVRGVEVVTAAYSHDKQPMDIQMTIQYQVNKDKVKEIAATYGTLSVLENRIQSVAIERTKSKLSNYDADSIIETRGAISAEVAQTVEEAIGEQYYVDITNVSLTNIDFSDAYEQSVEQSMIAKQEVEKAKAEAEKAIAAAEGELEVAKLQAQAKLEEAKADANAQIEIAKAESLAIQLKSIEVARALGFEIVEEVVENEDGTSEIKYTINFEGKSVEEIALITDYLKYIEYLAKWDGKLPTVTGDSATVVIPTI